MILNNYILILTRSWAVTGTQIGNQFIFKLAVLSEIGLNTIYNCSHIIIF